jgi:hypothetical protein
VLKREEHRRALRAAAASGSPKFFLGTDSAPHARRAKEAACGCAGIYTANAALELYASAFEEANALDRLEGFASFFGPDFYGLPRNAGSVTLQTQHADLARLLRPAVVPVVGEGVPLVVHAERPRVERERGGGVLGRGALRLGRGGARRPVPALVSPLSRASSFSRTPPS